MEELHAKSDVFVEFKVNAMDLIRKFFDPEILGGFLRSFGRNLLFYAGHAEELTRELEAFGPNGTMPLDVELVQEIAWAAVYGKIPQHAVLRLIDSYLNEYSSYLWFHPRATRAEVHEG
jgi:hypothetical protein